MPWLSLYPTTAILKWFVGCGTLTDGLETRPRPIYFAHFQFYNHRYISERWEAGEAVGNEALVDVRLSNSMMFCKPGWVEFASSESELHTGLCVAWVVSLAELERTYIQWTLASHKLKQIWTFPRIGNGSRFAHMFRGQSAFSLFRRHQCGEVEEVCWVYDAVFFFQLLHIIETQGTEFVFYFTSSRG